MAMRKWQVGDFHVEDWSVEQLDVDLFTDLTLDSNPVHYDKGYAARTRFERPVVPGALLFARIAGMVARKLPGPGAILSRVNLDFRHPIYPGDMLTVRLEVVATAGDWLTMTGQIFLADDMSSALLEADLQVLYEPAENT